MQCSSITKTGLTRRPIELELFLDVLTAATVRQVRFVAGGEVDITNGDG